MSRVVKLQLRDDNQQLVEIDMAQSLAWLEATDAKVGGTIDLDMPEVGAVGAVGEATVIAIESCPPTPPGSGNLVTAIFKHHAKQALNLHVANSVEPIGVTPNHPIWSEDRQQFVAAGHWSICIAAYHRVGSSPRSFSVCAKVICKVGPRKES